MANYYYLNSNNKKAGAYLNMEFECFNKPHTFKIGQSSSYFTLKINLYELR